MHASAEKHHSNSCSSVVLAVYSNSIKTIAPSKEDILCAVAESLHLKLVKHDHSFASCKELEPIESNWSMQVSWNSNCLWYILSKCHDAVG